MDLCNGVFRNKNGSATGLCGFPRTAPAAKSRPESAPLSVEYITIIHHHVFIQTVKFCISFKNYNLTFSWYIFQIFHGFIEE